MSSHRILLIGCSGSGKSTLTRELAKKLDLPVLHLDRIWHATNYDDDAKQFLRQTQLDFIAKNDYFIIDGNYTGTMDCRIPHANLIIWLQIPRRLAMYRIIMRSIKRKFGIEQRIDMADEFREKLNREYFEFLKFVWNFEKNSTPRIKAVLEHKAEDCRLVVIKNKKDQDVLLKQLVGKIADESTIY